MKGCENPECRAANLGSRPVPLFDTDNGTLCRSCYKAKTGWFDRPRPPVRENDQRTTEAYAHYVNGSLV